MHKQAGRDSDSSKYCSSHGHVKPIESTDQSVDHEVGEHLGVWRVERGKLSSVFAMSSFVMG